MPACLSSFRAQCHKNNGYNLLTFTLVLTFLTTVMFITSVIFTHLDYNRSPNRDWAWVGGVTSTSAAFRVRGPKEDNGVARTFVVSTNPNLAIEADRILSVPVSFNDFETEEHSFKRIQLEDLSPLNPYYYGILHPQRTPNSATMASDVGAFLTPAPEGTRMNFRIATGSCALTGSKSEVFSSITSLDPLMFIHMGDFHYEDLDTLDIDKRLEAFDLVMGSPTQRLLYMRSIFSYIWDDHDWLGNNEDADGAFEESANVAKMSYSLSVPHYPLGAIQSGASDNEGTAAKYQAFTIGTVRFIISDLRSESERSTDDYPGRIYSEEQKLWLFNELSQATNYDFVVWVTTRPWTDPVEVGSDSWGGFVLDRDELSDHIASVIGAGPQNLLVLSGDNHMVAFDDGSSTDFSGQDDVPGGFPLLHSGPLSNYGSGVKDFLVPDTNYFSDGCLAINSEVNFQFSTVDFTFPTEDNSTSDVEPCLEIKSYRGGASNVIFSKKICGSTMRVGAPEQNTCTLQKLSTPTQSLFIAGASLILLNSLLAFWYLEFSQCLIALGYLGLGILYYGLTILAAVAGAFCFGTLAVNVLAVSIFILAQSFLSSLFIGVASFGYYASSKSRSVASQRKVDNSSIEIAPEYNSVESKRSATDVSRKGKQEKKEASYSCGDELETCFDSVLVGS